MAITPEKKVKQKVVEQLKEIPDAYYFFPATGGYGRSGVPDIIVCNNWQTSMTPILLKEKIFLLHITRIIMLVQSQPCLLLGLRLERFLGGLLLKLFLV